MPKHTRIGVVVGGAALGMLVVIRCVPGSSATASGCGALALCCASLPLVDQGTCNALASSAAAGACAAELSALQTSGQCGNTATGCTALAACCPGVPASQQSACSAVAAAGVASACTAELGSFVAAGNCTSPTGGSGTGAGSAGCAGLAACCAILPVSEQSGCNAIVSAGTASLCADEVTALQTAGSCVSSGSGTGTRGSGTGSMSGTGSGSAGPTFGPGDGGACGSPVGGFPDPSCDPSDEQATYCASAPYNVATVCHLSPKCGDISTCEPFTTNPSPGSGVDNFRMRLINVTAPPTLASATVQNAIVTSAVDLPSSLDGGAPCGEDGTGLFNWLMSVDKAKGTVTTGGAPPSTDPFGLGYCFLRGTVGPTKAAVAPITVPATFTGDTFSTTPMPGLLNVPIFITGGSVIVLPLNNVALNNVTMSPDGNCIGAIDPYSIQPPNCVDPATFGLSSCSRWHSAGSLGGYITLAEADQVPVVALGGESLCYLITGQGNGASPQKCGANVKGDYCSTTGKACPGSGDSFWFAAQFAASAVNITAGAGISICNGGTYP